MHDSDGSQRRGRRPRLALTGMALLALLAAGCGDQLDDLSGWFDEDAGYDPIGLTHALADVHA